MEMLITGTQSGDAIHELRRTALGLGPLWHLTSNFSTQSSEEAFPLARPLVCETLVSGMSLWQPSKSQQNHTYFLATDDPWKDPRASCPISFICKASWDTVFKELLGPHKRSWENVYLVMINMSVAGDGTQNINYCKVGKVPYHWAIALAQFFILRTLKWMSFGSEAPGGDIWQGCTVRVCSEGIETSCLL